MDLSAIQGRADDGQERQDPLGRLEVFEAAIRKDVAGMYPGCYSNAFCRSGGNGRVPFEVYVRNSDRQPPDRVRLLGHCGPSEDLEPITTVMLPSED